MTYKEIEKKIIINNQALRRSANLEERRAIINENHELMKRLDEAWTKQSRSYEK